MLRKSKMKRRNTEPSLPGGSEPGSSSSSVTSVTSTTTTTTATEVIGSTGTRRIREKDEGGKLEKIFSETE